MIPSHKKMISVEAALKIFIYNNAKKFAGHQVHVLCQSILKNVFRTDVEIFMLLKTLSCKTAN